MSKNNPKRTYRYNLFWWGLFWAMGFLLFVLLLGSVGLNLGQLGGLWDYVRVAIIVLVMLPLGCLCILTPVYTKVVLSPQELEYHTLACVITVEWENLINMGPVTDLAGRTVWLVLQECDVVPRGWVKFAFWDAVKNTIRQGIPLARFGRLSWRPLKLDIERYAPQLLTATPTK